MGMQGSHQSAFAKEISTRLRRDSLHSLNDWITRQAVARGRKIGAARLRFRGVQAMSDMLRREILTGCAMRSPKGEAWWAHKGSNLGPLPCEGKGVLN